MYPRGLQTTRVPSRIVVERRVGMAMHPQADRRAEQVVELVDVGGVEMADIIPEALGDRAGGWSMMRDDHGLAREGFGQLRTQKSHRVAVVLHDVRRAQAPVVARADAAIVGHALPRLQRGQHQVAGNGEVGPEGCADEAHAVDHDLVAIQEVHLRVAGPVFHLPPACS